MKQFILILLTSIITLTLSLPTSAATQLAEQIPNDAPQGKHRNSPQFSPEEYMKRQEAFITNEARLTEAEARAFFPLFHKMKNELRNINFNIQKTTKQGRKVGLTDSQYTSLLKQIDKMKMNKLKIEQSYHAKFHNILSYKKIFDVMDANERFDRQMLRNMMKGKDRDKKR